MAIIKQLERAIKLKEKFDREKLEFDRRPYTQKVYNKDDKKKFPNNPEKWRVVKTINHKQS